MQSDISGSIMKYIFFLTTLVFSCQNRVKHATLNDTGVNKPYEKETTMKKNNFWQEHPNVYVRLMLTKNGPVLPKIEGYVEIWIKTPKFRVRDKTGRFVYEIRGDIASNRGLGQPPQSLEEIMDIQSRFMKKSDFGVTEFFGDIATGQGLVYESGSPPWAIEAKEILPLAEQIFSYGIEQHLKPVQLTSQFERACTEYHGFLDGQEAGVKFKSELRVIVSSPFVFLNEVHDAEIRNYYFIREFVEFREGKVTDADVEPPK